MKPLSEMPHPARLHHALFLAVAFVLCACGVTLPHDLVMRDVGFPLGDLRFPSGLRVIVDEDHRTPVVGVFLLVGAGSTSDPPGKEGLAHYVEHLAFRARPDGKTSISSLLERAGAASFNASTGLDYTIYWELGPKEALAPLVTLEGVRLRSAVANVTPEVAAVEREVVRNELRERNETGIYGSIFSYLQAAVFPAGHPYARPVIGNHESLSSLTLQDAQRFVAQSYRPENVTLVIVGDVDLQTVQPVVERTWPPELLAGAAAHPAQPRLSDVAPEPPEPPPAILARDQEAVAAPELWIGWSLPGSFRGEGYLAPFLSAVTQNALSNGLWHDDDIGAIQVRLVEGAEASMLLCRVELLNAAQPERSLQHVLDRVWTLWQVPLRSHVSLDPLQRTAVTAMLLDAENLIARGYARATITHFTGDEAAYAHRLKAAMQADRRHVAELAHKYVTRERARAVLVTPLPGRVMPEPEPEPTLALPLDEAPPSFDADAIHRYVHAPGVAAYRHVVLDNGLEVVIGRRTGLPIATVGLSLHGGAATAEPKGADDLARRLARPRFPRSVDAGYFGGHLFTRYERDQLVYTISAAAGNVANMLDVLSRRSQMMFVDSTVATDFDRDSIPLVAKLELAPEVQTRRAFRAALFGAHPYGRTLAANELAHLRAGDANDWLDRTAVPHNAVLAIVGEIDPDAVERLVRETFGGWSGAQPAQAPPPPPELPAKAPKPTAIVTHRAGATQAQIHLGCLLPPPGASRARYDVMARILSERLTNVVRRSLGASYGFHVDVAIYRGGAAELGLQGDVDNEHVSDALAALRRALILLERGHFKEGEVEAARWRAARAYAVRYTTNGAIVRSILAVRNEGRDVRALDTYPDDLLGVTPESLQADFARCAAAPVISLVGDEPTLRAALAQVWP